MGKEGVPEKVILIEPRVKSYGDPKGFYNASLYLVLNKMYELQRQNPKLKVLYAHPIEKPIAQGQTSEIENQISVSIPGKNLSVEDRSREFLVGHLRESNPDIDVKDITLISAERFTFGDSSLGCPEPGRMYTQAIVEGFKVKFSYKGKEYHVHSTADGTIFKVRIGG